MAVEDLATHARRPAAPFTWAARRGIAVRVGDGNGIEPLLAFSISVAREELPEHAQALASRLSQVACVFPFPASGGRMRGCPDAGVAIPEMKGLQRRPVVLATGEARP